MKASDIIAQLAVLLPKLTGEFTNEVSIQSITRSGTEMTAQCLAAHELSEGDAVFVVNAEMHIAISTLTRSGTIGTLITASDHDLTEKIAKTITISGASEAEFNGTFTRLNITNRRTITFVMPDSGPTTATGSPILHDSESALRQYDGLYKVTSTPTPSSFTFEHSVAGLADPTGSGIVARTKPRISGAIDIDRAAQAYTSQNQDKYWLFVVLNNVESSKSRDISSDAHDNLQRGHEYRQQVTQPFTIYVFIPVSQEIAAREARDKAELLFRPLCRSLLFSKFDSGLYSGKLGTVVFTGHGVYRYDSALYIHSFDFQQTVDLTFEDTVGPDLDVAFRDIALTIDPDLGTTTITANIDLDDTPL